MKDMDANFSTILDKFKQGANSMGEVYSELTYLTINYDKEIEKLQKSLEDEKTRANNEEFMRHGIEKDLADLKGLQQINFSIIVDELIKKPRDQFEHNIKQSFKKFTFTIIIFTIISLSIIVFTSFFFKNNETIPSEKNISEINTILTELRKENSQLKEFIQNSIRKITSIKNENHKISKPVQNKLMKENEIKKNKKEFNKAELTLNDKDEFLENILSILITYDKKFKLNSKNDSRLLYKIYLLDLAPFNHDLVLEEIKLFANNNTYIPTKEDLMIWDQQLLFIYTKMLEKIKNIPELNITSHTRSFDTYKKDDATLYTGWEYHGENNLSTKESLQKEIEKLQSQITLNSK